MRVNWPALLVPALAAALVAAFGFAIWRGLVGIARLYERRLLSDQTLLVDAVYLVFTFWSAAPQVTSS